MLLLSIKSELCKIDNPLIHHCCLLILHMLEVNSSCKKYCRVESWERVTNQLKRKEDSCLPKWTISLSEILYSKIFRSLILQNKLVFCDLGAFFVTIEAKFSFLRFTSFQETPHILDLAAIDIWMLYNASLISLADKQNILFSSVRNIFNCAVKIWAKAF